MKIIKPEEKPWTLQRDRGLDLAILERSSDVPKIEQRPRPVISAGFSFPSTINPTFSFHTSANRLCLDGVCLVSKGGINCRLKDTILKANRKDLVLLLTEI